MGTEVPAEAVVGLRSLPRRQIYMTLVGVMLAMFLSSLDQTIVSTAMPRIIADLGGFAHYTWLTTSYLVTSTVVLPITGKLTDMYGRKPFYIAGILIFVAGSLLSGLSQSMTQIIIFRGFQGIGAGVMMANSFTVIGDLFPPAERGKYIGYVSAVFGTSAIIGPILGGFITDTLSWHWIFYVNVPLGIMVTLVFIFFFPAFRPDNLKHHIDYAGIAVLILAVIPLLLALSWGGTEYPWNSAPVIGMFLLSAVAMVLFPLIELKAKEPTIPLRIFKNPIVAIAVPIIFFSGFGMFGGIIFVPLYFQGVLGLSATASGSFLTPMTLGQVTGSFLSGQVLSRTGGHYRLQGAFGLAVMALGLWFLSRMTPETNYASAVVNIIMVGFGLGVTLPLYTIAVQNAVPYNILGAATSSVPFFRSIGGSAGLAIFGSVMSNRFASEFMAGLPGAIKEIVPPQMLSDIASNPQVLVSPEAQLQLQTLFSQMGQQGATLYEQFLQTMRQALNTSLSEVFFITLVVTVLVFIINFFLKEVPLRRQHMVSEPANGEAAKE